ncbi:MAG: glycosyltransferase [Chthoniobacterales bacterium]|nr:glycosyltransferase [Chthoniobacterales bacterium]
MKLVIFGLTISSSWGNGHATILRGLLRQLIARGHEIVFFERDAPYYAAHRDLSELPGGSLQLYAAWPEVLPIARRHLADCDVAMVTSYCPDGIAASELICSSAAFRVFYDLDTPVTLSRLRNREPLSYLDERGLRDFDLVLSFTGGGALAALKLELGARRVAPLYGSVDPEVHWPTSATSAYLGNFSYLGTYAADRQAALERLFLAPARQLPSKRFVIAGAQYPADFPWSENISFVRHLPPNEHPTFFCSSRLTLNVTRAAMAAMGWCPSGRLFEAAACGVPIVSDNWEGLDEFFTADEEIIVAETSDDALAALEMSDAELRRISLAARDRVLAEHTAEARALELEQILNSSRVEAQLSEAQPC